MFFIPALCHRYLLLQALKLLRSFGKAKEGKEITLLHEANCKQSSCRDLRNNK